ncbi:MAG: hybrid sensor histidine kinase/response regulator [Verrucomicrobia bacterium]|nr:hybrid sensor histidine kinase/response regulator [Verrucomicrobiota bacterium]MDE3099675.1 hybrid sensor histidine kinase/response regulator [Verrucomicrobiota bacterium]
MNARSNGSPGPEPVPAHSRILVVDDQSANVQIVGSILGNLDHEIIPAGDGATALKRVAARKPDLILLDLLMPDMDGCEVCRHLKQNPEWAPIPVIFLSAADDKDLIVRALNAGGVDYITKPFNHAELISRVRTQLALKQARDRLQQLAEDKDELLGILAHDLKNHLGGMKMSAELMHRQVEKLNDERLDKLSHNILRSSSQLLAFVKQFLANAAADYNFTPHPGNVNLVQVADNSVQEHLRAARQKDLEILTDFPDNGATVLADASALDQIMDNLISNAVKFSPPGTKIHVSVAPSDSAVRCVVRDEGPGFTAEDKERMFRRYGRLSARPTGGEPSTGLGLSIVRKLVDGMQGRLFCDNAPGGGAAFAVELPKVKENK